MLTSHHHHGSSNHRTPSASFCFLSETSIVITDKRSNAFIIHPVDPKFSNWVVSEKHHIFWILIPTILGYLSSLNSMKIVSDGFLTRFLPQHHVDEFIVGWSEKWVKVRAYNLRQVNHNLSHFLVEIFRAPIIRGNFCFRFGQTLI